MRKLILGAAAALLVCGLPAVASAQSGYVDLGYANSDSDFGDDNIDTWTVGGAVGLDLGSLGAQIDGRYANLSVDDDDTDTFAIGGHLFHRDSTWLFGGYAGYDKFDVDGGDDIDEWTVAGETQFYMTNSTVSASLSYSDSEDAFLGEDLTVWSLDGDYKYFVNDNWSIHGGAGYGQAELGPLDDVDAWQAGVGTEYQFAGAPISVFGNYRHSSLDFGGGLGDDDSDTLSVGVRYNFGGSLLDRDRSGAGLSAPAGGLSRLLGVFS